ncbi:MAG: hypothetical protein QOJ02_348 [Acidobacteriota bacterium]|jgi:hypothetical protein|nr:hypothetical protein [Acidobacteriota bacterium]
MIVANASTVVVFLLIMPVLINCIACLRLWNQIGDSLSILQRVVVAL